MREDTACVVMDICVDQKLNGLRDIDRQVGANPPSPLPQNYPFTK